MELLADSGFFVHIREKLFKRNCDEDRRRLFLRRNVSNNPPREAVAAFPSLQWCGA
jgi:hypothetical protein